MRRSIAVIVGVVGFLALLGTAALWFIPEVEAELTSQATDELAAAGIPAATVSFDGRDGTVTGPDANIAADHLDGRLSGARWVLADIEEPEPDERAAASTTAPTTSVPASSSTVTALGDAEPDDAGDEQSDATMPESDSGSDEAEPMGDGGIEVTATRDDNVIVLAGVVGSDDDRDILVREVIRAGYLADDQLVVDESLDGDTLAEEAAGVIRPILRGSEDGSFALGDGVVTVFGTASDPVAAEVIDEAIAYAAARGVLIDADITTAVLTEEQQIVALQAEIDQIFELARRIQEVRPSFEPTEGELNASAVNILDRVSVAMRRYPLPTVDAVGHTDSAGPIDENQTLSELRATTVVDYLTEQGIEPERLAAIGRGELEPIATNATPEGRLENRRVNFIVQKREG